MAFYSIEPFGFEANLMGSCIVSATVANAQRTKESDKVWDWTDFMPKMEEKEEQTTEEMIEFASMMTVAMGGKDMRKKNVNDS